MDRPLDVHWPQGETSSPDLCTAFLLLQNSPKNPQHRAISSNTPHAMDPVLIVWTGSEFSRLSVATEDILVPLNFIHACNITLIDRKMQLLHRMHSQERLKQLWIRPGCRLEHNSRNFTSLCLAGGHHRNCKSRARTPPLETGTPAYAGTFRSTNIA